MHKFFLGGWGIGGLGGTWRSLYQQGSDRRQALRSSLERATEVWGICKYYLPAFVRKSANGCKIFPPFHHQIAVYHSPLDGPFSVRRGRPVGGVPGSGRDVLRGKNPRRRGFRLEGRSQSGHSRESNAILASFSIHNGLGKCILSDSPLRLHPAPHPRAQVRSRQKTSTQAILRSLPAGISPLRPLSQSSRAWPSLH